MCQDDGEIAGVRREAHEVNEGPHEQATQKGINAESKGGNAHRATLFFFRW